MKKLTLYSAFLIGLLFSSAVLSSSIGFGIGTQHINPAYTAPKGSLFMTTYSRAFFKDEVISAPDGTSTGETYWDIQGGLGLFYGFNNHLELGFSQVMYQDNHKSGKGYNLPDDISFRAKLGSLGPANGNLRFGVQFDLRLPLAEYHNIPLESYSAGRIGVGVMGLVSIISEPLYPELDVNINANIGLFTHNDLGSKLTKDRSDTITVDNTTKEILFGMSFSKVLQEFSIFAELYGRTFLQKPPVTAYTRESTMYLSPGISYAPNNWMRFRVALDMRILGSKDETIYDDVLPLPWETVPNMPSWRINVGAVIALKPSKTTLLRYTDAQESSYSVDSPQTEEKIYSDLASERRKTERAEVELERIRTERQRMEDLLERLRKILEYPSQIKQEENKSSSQEPE